MKFFVTGASGLIGSAVTTELLAAGHEVAGLARSNASAAAVEALGATVHRGSLDDLDSLAAGAAASDGVVHLAFKHDVVNAGGFLEAVEADAAAVAAMGEALTGTDRPFAVASGTMMAAMIAPGTVGTEDLLAGPEVPGRAAVERRLTELSGVRGIALRFAPTVHGAADRHGFVPSLIGFARDSGAAAYVGDGANRWPAVHVSDAARLVRLALDTAPAGSRLHVAGETGVPFREIAEAIGRLVGVPTVSVTAEHAAEHLGFLGAFAGIDNPVATDWTRATLGWDPVGPGVVEEIDGGVYAAG